MRLIDFGLAAGVTEGLDDPILFPVTNMACSYRVNDRAYACQAPPLACLILMHPPLGRRTLQLVLSPPVLPPTDSIRRLSQDRTGGRRSNRGTRGRAKPFRDSSLSFFFPFFLLVHLLLSSTRVLYLSLSLMGKGRGPGGSDTDQPPRGRGSEEDNARIFRTFGGGDAHHHPRGEGPPSNINFKERTQREVKCLIEARARLR